MLRRLHLILAALAMLVAPIAMQSGVAMAAMPMDHGEMAQAGHCGGTAPVKKDKPAATKDCCVTMCSAVAALGASPIDPPIYHAPMLFGLRPTEHRPFLPELPTPPPRDA
ncbi:MAG: hypothetical protein ACEQR8_10345 [Cypionkella sp.]